MAEFIFNFCFHFRFLTRQFFFRFRSCYPLLSPSSFYSSEVKVYTDNELPPVGTLGGQEDMQFNKPSAVIQQVSVHKNGLIQQSEEEEPV